MVMSKSDVLTLANEVLIPGYQEERTQLDEIDKWYRWNPVPIRLPGNAKAEERYLRELAETPWLGLVVTTVAQQIRAELCRSGQVTDTSAVWGPWLRNRMPSRQRAIHRAALAYGYSYTTVMPGDTGSVIRGYSPRNMFAVYQDPVVDEYPAYYIRVNGNRYTVVDEEASYTLVDQNGKLEYATHDIHAVGVAPAIRYSNQIDLEGRTPGEVEPFIPIAKRINKTAFDRMLIQHHSSFQVITATGLEEPTTQADADDQKLKIRQGDILTGGSDVEFDTLPPSPLDGILKAGESDVETLAAVSQTPTHAMTGKMINLSADAIAEARSMLDLKAGERKLGFGDSHVQTLRLAAHIEGRERDAQDFTLRIEWEDLGSRSMSQAADALGKMATMLEIPREKLWDRIPGVSAEDAEMWLKYRKENPSADQRLATALENQSNGVNG